LDMMFVVEALPGCCRKKQPTERKDKDWSGGCVAMAA